MLISNVQRFCLHDGPGIRTTVFFMGCNLNCFWCCNPENMIEAKREYIKNDIRGIYGKEYDTDELVEIILRDKPFYSDCGGVTFSGGECLLQLHKNTDLLDRLHSEGVNICIETALAVDGKLLKPIIKYVDKYYIDLKIFTDDASRINFNKQNFFKNLELINQENKKVTFRIPLVKGFNDSDENLSIINNIITDFKPDSVECFQIHNLAKDKYKSLNMHIFNPDPFTDEELNNILNKVCYDKVKLISI